MSLPRVGNGTSAPHSRRARNQVENFLNQSTHCIRRRLGPTGDDGIRNLLVIGNAAETDALIAVSGSDTEAKRCPDQFAKLQVKSVTAGA